MNYFLVKIIYKDSIYTTYFSTLSEALQWVDFYTNDDEKDILKIIVDKI